MRGVRVNGKAPPSSSSSAAYAKVQTCRRAWRVPARAYNKATRACRQVSGRATISHVCTAQSDAPGPAQAGVLEHGQRQQRDNMGANAAMVVAKVRRGGGPAKALLACLLAALVLAVSTPLSHALASATAATTTAASSSSALSGIISFVLHFDKHLASVATEYGGLTYAILFAIVFAETGLVVTPFLPGDSLLFACGAFAAKGVFQLTLLAPLLFAAAVLGDAVNYAIGKYFGRVLVERYPKTLAKPVANTEAFYDKYGGKAVVLARFVPIVRTFAPFVAGVARMAYSKFAAFNVGGAAIWVFGFTGLGYFAGNLPIVKKNFSIAMLLIVLVSVVPVIFEVLSSMRASRRSS